MLDHTLLDNPAALLTRFTHWYANVDRELHSPEGESVDLSYWRPIRVAVSPCKGLVAILAEQGEHQRADIYDVANDHFICMREASLFDAEPVFDLRFRAEPGRIDFVFEDFDEATPTQRKFWPGGFSLRRGEWIMPSPAELDETPPRGVSESALARHPNFANLDKRPKILSGPAADFGVHHSFEYDSCTGDFFGYVSVHGDSGDYVARIDGHSGELLWKTPIATYSSYQRIGDWVVTKGGVYEVGNGKQVCTFDCDPEITPIAPNVLLAPDNSLWIAVNQNEAPGRFLRAIPASGNVQILQLDYLRLFKAGALWVGCFQDENGVVTLHGLDAPIHGELLAPRWTKTLSTEVGQAVLGHRFCTASAFQEHYLVGVDASRWWILELATGETWSGTLEDGYSWHSLHCIDEMRAYFSAGTDSDQTIHWLDLNTREIGTVPLKEADWQCVHVEKDVIYAIENWGASMVTRHVPAVYDLETGERLWEGVHTRLCNVIAPTRTGIAVGGPIGELYLFEQDTRQLQPKAKRSFFSFLSR